MVSKAQGTIEYLVILAIIVVISLVVVSLITNSVPSDNIVTTTGKISSSVGSGSISVSEAVLDSDGEGLITISSTQGETTKLKKIMIGDEEVPYDDPTLQTSTPTTVSFNILSTNSCSCDGRTGTIACPVTIYQESQYGTTTTTTINMSLECVDDAEPVDDDRVIEASFNCTGTVPYDATICPNDDEDLNSNTTLSLVDSCGTSKCEYVCNPHFSRNGNVCIFDEDSFTAFVDDGTIFWQPGDSNETLAWSPDAFDYCSNLALCYDDTFDSTGNCAGSGVAIESWELPNYTDSVYYEGHYFSHESNLTGFFNNSPFTYYGYYWTSTEDELDSSKAYYVDLSVKGGDILSAPKDGSGGEFRVRCAVSEMHFSLYQPTSDGGDDCTDSNQCQSYCIAPSGSSEGDEVIGTCYNRYGAVCRQEVFDGVVVPELCHGT